MPFSGRGGTKSVQHLIDLFMGIVCLLNDFGLLNRKRDAGTFTGHDHGSLTVSLCMPTIRIDLGDGAGCAVQAAKKAHHPETNGFHKIEGILCHEKSANSEED